MPALPAHKAWSRIVDRVAAMDSKEELPAEYNLIHFLPDEQPLDADMLAQLRTEGEDFNREAAAQFQTQISFTESCHAKPVLPKFISNPSEVVFSLTDTHGPDFYRGYKAVSSASPSSAAASSRQRRRTTAATAMNANSSSSPSRLASGIMDSQRYQMVHRQPDFMPVIFVPSSVSAPLQLINIRSFLEQGVYVDPISLFVEEETGAVYVTDVKPESVMVNPGSFLDRDTYKVAFRQFRVVDDPAQVTDWSHVCACLVEGKEWQFAGWYPDERSSACQPSQLFNRVRGFLPYFEEDKVPPATQQWRVQPLLLTRRGVKAHQHILQASVFWEQLYTFLDEHPFFRWYTVDPDS